MKKIIIFLIISFMFSYNPVFSQTEETEVSTTILLKDVKSVSLKFSQGNQWVDEWPFLDWTTNNGLPKIVELSYEIEGLGQIMRRYMLPFEA